MADEAQCLLQRWCSTGRLHPQILSAAFGESADDQRRLLGGDDGVCFGQPLCEFPTSGDGSMTITVPAVRRATVAASAPTTPATRDDHHIARPNRGIEESIECDTVEIAEGGVLEREIARYRKHLVGADDELRLMRMISEDPVSYAVAETVARLYDIPTTWYPYLTGTGHLQRPSGRLPKPLRRRARRDTPSSRFRR